ncbi:sigma-54-dependent transcriptional regulator [Pseudomonas oryzae]|nr:sigma 54-interacting transcriptional regulator [Pseudomonas oryzae]
MIFAQIDAACLDVLRAASHEATVLVIVLWSRDLTTEQLWALLHAGAADVLVWQELPASMEPVLARLQRWQVVEQLAEEVRQRGRLVGQSQAWRSLLRQLIEVAAFSPAPVLIIGESGTGKELLAGLVHELDPRRSAAELVVVDCTTVTAELSGSEFFGHERGAFTGAVNARDGAFALANGGTLFLDEIGELPLALQAQLLRVIQEHQYKRVGSNLWQFTDFRLVCATNRDLEAEIHRGRFRSDLYFRIAGWIFRTPPLRERREDILPLATHFIAEANPEQPAPDFDDAVREYLLTRDYPGNVRDLRRVVARLQHRHVGPGPITVGDVPEEERPRQLPCRQDCFASGFEAAIRQALSLGVGLREIREAAAEVAIRLAIEEADGNLHRAASRLGVTDRALQYRRAHER